MYTHSRVRVNTNNPTLTNLYGTIALVNMTDIPPTQQNLHGFSTLSNKPVSKTLINLHD